MGVKSQLSWSSFDIGERFWNTVRQNWYLGFTSFGGPPVHFKIVSIDSMSGKGARGAYRIVRSDPDRIDVHAGGTAS
jgi:hypothetical protein